MDDCEKSSSSSDEFYEKIRAQLNKMDDEEKSSRIISKNEVLPQVQLRPPETREEREINFNYKPTNQLQLIGKIESINKDNLIVYSNLLEFVINLDQLLLTKEQEILGKVDDVFGKVERPHYSVLMDGYLINLVEQKKVQVSDDVYVNMDSASILNPDAIRSLLKKKGCDASNQFDEEILNDGDVEYSDDEKEAQHKKKGNREDGEIKDSKKKHKKPEQREKPEKQHNQQRMHPQQQQQFMNQQQQYQMFMQSQMQFQQQQYQNFLQQQQQFYPMQFMGFQQQPIQQMQPMQQYQPNMQQTNTQQQPNINQMQYQFTPQQLNQTLFQNINPNNQDKQQ